MQRRLQAVVGVDFFTSVILQAMGKRDKQKPQPSHDGEGWGKFWPDFSA